MYRVLTCIVIQKEKYKKTKILVLTTLSDTTQKHCSVYTIIHKVFKNRGFARQCSLEANLYAMARSDMPEQHSTFPPQCKPFIGIS
jgi:hypothetical protein